MKRKLALILVISLILSLSAFSTVSFAADSGEIYITTGEEFEEKVISENFGSTFIIQNAIELPEDYSSIEGFYGTIKGADENVSITFSNSNPLILTLGQGEVNISNLTLDGDVEIASTVVATGSYTSSAALIAYGATARSITLNKIVNNVKINTAATYAGSLVGYYGQSKNLIIKNCINNAALNGKTFGGFVGAVRNATVEITDCYNYGDITASSHVGGIYGTDYNASDYSNLTIKKCVNYGDITLTATGSANYAGGIAGSAFSCNISNSYNAGVITSASRCIAGILANSTSSASVVENCFNAGKIYSTNGNSGRRVCGIARGNALVKNCYNVGVVDDSSTGSGYLYPITNSTTVDCENNYYTNTEKASSSSVGALKTIEELAAGLDALGFSTDVWEYVETDENNKYSLPQIKGNTFVTTDTTWYVAPVVEPEEDVTVADGTLSFSSADDSSFVPTTSDTGEEITTAYAVVAGRFSLANGVTENDIVYGMLISKTVSGEDLTAETCTREAVATKNVGGAYGILFYGNMTPGDTYYVRPYVKYNDVYTYGEASSFVFPE